VCGVSVRASRPLYYKITICRLVVPAAYPPQSIATRRASARVSVFLSSHPADRRHRTSMGPNENVVPVFVRLHLVLAGIKREPHEPLREHIVNPTLYLRPLHTHRECSGKSDRERATGLVLIRNTDLIWKFPRAPLI
jgi:hypothetical protein